MSVHYPPRCENPQTAHTATHTFLCLGPLGKRSIDHPQAVNCLANSFCYTWSDYVIMMVMVIYHINSIKRKVDNHPGANLTS